MVIGVTGGSGFIAGHVIDLLHSKGHETVTFDRREPTGFLGDLRDRNAVAEFVAHTDGVIHLAGVLGTQETIDDPYPSAEVNIMGGLNVFEAVTRHKVPCVNIAVGNWWMPATYPISKNCAERFTEMFNEYRGATIANVRVVNAYGPRQVPCAPFGPSKVRKVTPSFVCRALSGLPIEIYGDGEQISDMVHVTDVAEVLVAALGSKANVEVGPVRSNTVNEFAYLIATAVEELHGREVEITHLPMRPGETPGAEVTANLAALPEIGIDPTDFVPLSEGVFETVKWYADNEGVTWQK